MIDMLVKADYLFLDDLGKESTFGKQTKEANDWKQNILYQILDERDTTMNECPPLIIIQLLVHQRNRIYQEIEQCKEMGSTKLIPTLYLHIPFLAWQINSMAFYLQTDTQ